MLGFFPLCLWYSFLPDSPELARQRGDPNPEPQCQIWQQLKASAKTCQCPHLTRTKGKELQCFSEALYTSTSHKSELKHNTECFDDWITDYFFLSKIVVHWKGVWGILILVYWGKHHPSVSQCPPVSTQCQKKWQWALTVLDLLVIILTWLLSYSYHYRSPIVPVTRLALIYP